MRILVCMKLVSQAQFADFLQSGYTDRLSGGQLGINPVDLYALEIALRIKDRIPDTEISVMTMGPDYAEHELRNALAMGADKAILITDRLFAGADTLRTAAILAAAIQKLPAFDLILCGKKSIDSETGHIGPQLATCCGLLAVNNVTEFSLENGGIRLERTQDDGLVRLWEPTPALLTLCYGTETVRSPGIAGLRRSRNAEILYFHAADLAEETLPDSGTETIDVKMLGFSERSHDGTETVEEGIRFVMTVLEAIQTEAAK